MKTSSSGTSQTFVTFPATLALRVAAYQSEIWTELLQIPSFRLLPIKQQAPVDASCFRSYHPKHQLPNCCSFFVFVEHTCTGNLKKKPHSKPNSNLK